MRKFIIATISAIAMAFLFVGCSKGLDKQLHGTWEITHIGKEGMMVEITPEILKKFPASIKMTFNADGTFRFENHKIGVPDITGKYTIKDKEINCKPGNMEGDIKFEIVSLSDKTLELKHTIEKDFVMAMKFKKI